MKQAVSTVLILLCTLHVSWTLNVILVLRIREARLTCEKIHGSDIMAQFREEVARTKEIPNNEKYNCFTACWMKELRQVKDGKLDVEEILRITKDEMKSNLVNLDNVSNVIKMCAKRVEEGDKTKNECDLVYRYLKCVADESKKLSLQP